MTVNKPFRMTVQAVTSIPGTKGKICLATGEVERGALSFGDEVLLMRKGICVKKTVVPCIEASCRMLVDRAECGTTVSLYLSEMIETEVRKGDIVLGVQPTSIESPNSMLWS